MWFCILGEGEEVESNSVAQRNMVRTVAGAQSHHTQGWIEENDQCLLTSSGKEYGDGLSPGGKVEHRQPKDPYEARSLQVRISENSGKSKWEGYDIEAKDGFFFLLCVDIDIYWVSFEAQRIKM